MNQFSLAGTALEYFHVCAFFSSNPFYTAPANMQEELRARNAATGSAN